MKQWPASWKSTIRTSGSAKSFEFSAIPDEQYVQTLRGLSSLTRECRPFMHADFSRDPRPYVYRAAAELSALFGGPYRMARKVDINAPDIAAYMQALADV